MFSERFLTAVRQNRLTAVFRSRSVSKNAVFYYLFWGLLKIFLSLCSEALDAILVLNVASNLIYKAFFLFSE